MFQGLPLDPSCLSEPVLLGLVVATVEPSQGGLDYTSVTLREGGRVTLQDSDAVTSLQYCLEPLNKGIYVPNLLNLGPETNPGGTRC